MKVFFAGDVFIGGDLFSKPLNSKDIIRVKSYHDADKRVINLEQAISDTCLPLDKGTLHGNSLVIEQLKQLNIDAVNLANNHIHDLTPKGITDTIDLLNKSGIAYFGAGKNIKEASKAYFLNEKIAVLGYCDYDKTYLKQIQVADGNTPGVNPLRSEKIIEDLDKLPDNCKAVLYFHWGREHVSLPEYGNIQLSKDILKNKKVYTIIGMHPHRIQGDLTLNDKKVFFSLGNFLFPNFYIKPPTMLVNNPIIENRVLTTYQYHVVYDLTYKMWKSINRKSLSILINFDNSDIKKIFASQKRKEPVIVGLNPTESMFLIFKIWLLSLIYKFPKKLYELIEFLNSTFVDYLWRLKNKLFQLRQLGLKKFYLKIFKH